MTDTQPHETHPATTTAAPGNSPPASLDEIQLIGPETSTATPPPAFRSHSPTPPHSSAHLTMDVREPFPERVISPPRAPPVPSHEEGIEEEQIPPDPRVAPLKAMFPDMDDSILLSVLESVGGNEDRAIDILLGMSDPDYVSQQHPQQQEQPVSQTDLDEQLARRLMLEEQENAARHYQSQQSQQQRRGHPNPQRRSTNVGTTGGYAQEWYGNENQRDTVTEFQESVNKIAESGKRTFNSIVSKVRSKMQEYNETRSGQPSSQQQQPGQGRQQAPYYAPQTVTQADWSAGQPRTNTYGQPMAATPRATRQTQPQPQSNVSNIGGGRWQYDAASTAPAATGGGAALGYDVQDDPVESLYQDTAAPGIPPHAGSPPPATPAGEAAPSRPSFGADPSTPRTSTEGGIPRPPSTNAGSPGSIDPSKLGILPKRPVSLLRPSSPPAAGSGAAPPARRRDSDDELEYAENPFEDRG